MTLVAKLFAGLVLFFLAISQSYAQDKRTSDAVPLPYCDGSFDLCGYMDAAQWKADKTRKTVFPLTFQMAKKFNEDLAPVRIDGKWGYINRDFQVVIEPKFDLAGRFDNGIAQVLVNRKAGIIGQDGQFIIEPQFAQALPLTKSVFIAETGERSSYWLRTDKLSSYFLGSHRTYRGQLYHISKGSLTKPGMAFRRFGKNATNLIWAKTDDYALWGLMRSNGKWKIRPRFKDVFELSMGRAVVSKTNNTRGESLLWGALDAKGRVAVPIKFGEINGWSDGWGEFSRVRKGEKVGALDRNGKLIGGRYFDDYEFPFILGQPTNVLENDTWLSIGPGGSLGPVIGYTAIVCDNGLSLIKYAKTMDYISPTGERVRGGPFKYNYMHKTSCGAPISVHKGDMHAFVTPDGTLIGDTLKINNSYGFEDGLAFVKVGKKWGILKSSGDYLVPPKYDALGGATSSVYKVRIGEITSFISRDGTVVPAPDEIPLATRKAPYLECRGGARLVIENKKWGMVSENGEVLIPPIHDLMSCYKNGVAWVPDDHKAAWCPIDVKGSRVNALACKLVYYPYFITHHDPERLDPDKYKNSVMWTRAYYEYGAGLHDDPPRMIHHQLLDFMSDAEIAKIPTKDLRSGTHSGYRN